LRSLIEQDEPSLRRFHSCNGSEARGLFVLLTDEEAFDNALAAAYAERMRHGRSWSGYCLPVPLAPSKSPSDIALLEADLSALFREFDGTHVRRLVYPAALFTHLAPGRAICRPWAN
jgi:hypothetical protein